MESQSDNDRGNVPDNKTQNQEDNNRHGDASGSGCSSDFCPNDNRAKWLNSVLAFMTGTHANSLNLSQANITPDEALLIVKSLINSPIIEIDLSCNCLQDSVKYLTELLVQTKLRKLNVSECKLTKKDVLQLTEILKDTEITDLDVSGNMHFDEITVAKFVTFLFQSRITNLSIQDSNFYRKAGTFFAESLPNTSITHLNVSCTMKKLESRDAITLLFSILPRTAITDLNLTDNQLNSTEIEKLSRSLKESKLEKLDLSWNRLKDCDVNSLAKGLVGSKISDLNLSGSFIFGKNNLGHHLKHTRIKTLNLSIAEIKDEEMFNFPDFLRGTAVTSLNVFGCCLHDRIGQNLIKSLAFTEIEELYIGKNVLRAASFLEFSQILKHTNLTRVDFSSHSFTPEGFTTLGESLQEPKLKKTGNECEKQSSNDSVGQESNATTSTPQKTTKFSQFKEMLTLKLKNISLKGNIENERTFVKRLNASLTYVNLSNCKLNPAGALSLAAILKCSAITHLELEGNNLRDEGLKTLAECLKQTQIVELNVSRNEVTSKGAKVLANAFTDTNLLYVHLKSNRIKDDSVLYLAEKISSTVITILDVRDDGLSRESDYILDQALWENRKIVHQLLNCFKRIAPEENDDNFQFDCNADSFNLDSSLDDCLFLYKTVRERPSAVNVLAQKEYFSRSKSEIIDLMEHFPLQFASFVSRKVEADVTEHVNLLKRIEGLGLSKITEHLLLHRPVYVIDESEDILHPYVYKLMHQYKQPIVNSLIERHGKDKIINYFNEHNDIDGASDIISLLS